MKRQREGSQTTLDHRFHKPKRSKRDETKDPVVQTRAEADDKTTPPPVSSNNDGRLVIVEEEGDIFNGGPNSIIVHACNCQGIWGAGIAKAFKQRYPQAYTEYHDLCKRRRECLIGTAQLIPPTGEGQHFVGCLFTSVYAGRRKGSPSEILKATKPAMQDLLNKIRDWNDSTGAAGRRLSVDQVRMCKINSGLFNVPWDQSKAKLEAIDVTKSGVKRVKVVSPPSESLN